MNNKIINSPFFIFLVYLVLHLAIRLMLSDTLQVDDADELIYGQELAWGYQTTQPPLYTWLSWIFFKILGPSLTSLSILKYMLIALTFWLAWKNINVLFFDSEIKRIAMFCFLLMPSFAWHMHQGFTHTIILGLAIMMTLHALLKINKNSSYLNYIYFGFALGIGVISKYSYFIFLFLMILSIFSTQKFRKNLFEKNIFLTMLVMLLIAFPHFSWLSDISAQSISNIDNKLKFTLNDSLSSVINSLFELSLKSLAFVSPFIIILLTNFKHFSKRKNYFNQDKFLLIRNFYYFAFLLSLIFVFFINIPHIKVRWLHPLMMLFPFFLLQFFQTGNDFSALFKKIFYPFLIFISIVIFVLRIVMSSDIAPEIGKYGRLNIPIIETIKKVDQKYGDNASFHTKDKYLYAHLLSYLPVERIYKYSSDQSLIQIEIWDDDDARFLPKEVEENYPFFETEKGNFSYRIFYSIKK